MSFTVTTIMLGVEDMDRAKKFYGEGLGATVVQDHPAFVLFTLGEGSSSLGLYPRDFAAQDAGVSAEGSGFRGMSFHHIVEDGAAVDEVLAKAEAAGGTIVKPAAGAQWGGCFGYFADPDGYLWKVAASS